MGLRTETFGNYDIKPMADGKYAVACNNGNIGACIMDEEGLKKFKEKYSGTSDTVEISSKAPRMSYEEARNIASMLLIPGANFLAIINPKTKEAMEALEYYRNNDVVNEKHSKSSDALKITSKAPKMSYEEARNIASMLTIPGANFFATINPKTKEAMEALEYYRNNGVA